jgi:hypothetical protein
MKIFHHSRLKLRGPRRIKPSWSIIGLVVAAFTIIAAGIGLIQARFAAEAVYYGNYKNLPDPGLTNARLEQQSNLFYPLGLFLVTLGLAMIFSTALWVGLPLLFMERKLEQEKKVSRIKTLGFTNLALTSASIALAIGAYAFSLNAQLAVVNLATTFVHHLSFDVGFAVLTMIFYVILDITLREQPIPIPQTKTAHARPETL